MGFQPDSTQEDEKERPKVALSTADDSAAATAESHADLHGTDTAAVTDADSVKPLPTVRQDLSQIHVEPEFLGADLRPLQQEPDATETVDDEAADDDEEEEEEEEEGELEQQQGNCEETAATPVVMISDSTDSESDVQLLEPKDDCPSPVGNNANSVETSSDAAKCHCIDLQGEQDAPSTSTERKKKKKKKGQQGKLLAFQQSSSGTFIVGDRDVVPMMQRSSGTVCLQSLLAAV